MASIWLSKCVCVFIIRNYQSFLIILQSAIDALCKLPIHDSVE